MQSRGYPHIHGMAWSDMEELERKYPGLKATFLKLKKRERLVPEDIWPLQMFTDDTVTCTTDVQQLRNMFKPSSNDVEERDILWDELTGEEEEEQGDRVGRECIDDCNGDFSKCNNCAMECAKMVREKVLEVNVHHHTKTCRKKGPKCRFNIPRCPSGYTLVAQKIPEEVTKQETETMASIQFVMKRVETHLKVMDEDLLERQRVDKAAQIEVTLEQMLGECFPEVSISDDEQFIIFKEGDKEYRFKTVLVHECWRQNPKYDESPINLLAPHERLRSALYHFSLSVITYGTKVILKRDPRDILINNYNPIWMLVWDGNMDIQICLDYFSIITYMTDYVCKAETKTSEMLKEVKKAKEKEKVGNNDLMYALAQAYLTSREMGESEAYYKLYPNLHYKQSNVKTVFIASGFPNNRPKFLRRCRSEAEENRGISVNGHEGMFIETEDIHTKYMMRPQSMERLCLCQLGMRYTQVFSFSYKFVLHTNIFCTGDSLRGK